LLRLPRSAYQETVTAAAAVAAGGELNERRIGDPKLSHPEFRQHDRAHRPYRA
jgi:hypothetical protein